MNLLPSASPERAPARSVSARSVSARSVSARSRPEQSLPARSAPRGLILLTPGWFLVLAGALAAAVCGLLPEAASAQESSPRFWGGVGVGTGSARVSCDICENDREAGMTASAALGFGLGERVRLGVEGNAWLDQDDNLDTLLWSATFSGYLYPRGTEGLWTKAGMGIMRYRAETDRDDVEANAFGVLIGAGYDIPMSGPFTVGPFVTLATSSRADLKRGETVVRNRVSHSLIHLGVVFHIR